MITNTHTSLPFHLEIPTQGQTPEQPFLAEEEIDHLLLNFPLEKPTTTDTTMLLDSIPTENWREDAEKKVLPQFRLGNAKDEKLFSDFRSKLSSLIYRVNNDLEILLKSPVAQSGLSKTLKIFLFSLREICDQYSSSRVPNYRRVANFRAQIGFIIEKIEEGEYMSKIESRLVLLHKDILRTTRGYRRSATRL